MAFKADMEQVEFLNIDYWFYAYGGIKSFEGMGHLGRMSDHGVLLRKLLGGDGRSTCAGSRRRAWRT